MSRTLVTEAKLRGSAEKLYECTLRLSDVYRNYGVWSNVKQIVTESSARYIRKNLAKNVSQKDMEEITRKMVFDLFRPRHNLNMLNFAKYANLVIIVTLYLLSAVLAYLQYKETQNQGSWEYIIRSAVNYGFFGLKPEYLTKAYYTFIFATGSLIPWWKLHKEIQQRQHESVMESKTSMIESRVNTIMDIVQEQRYINACTVILETIQLEDGKKLQLTRSPGGTMRKQLIDTISDSPQKIKSSQLRVTWNSKKNNKIK